MWKKVSGKSKRLRAHRSSGGETVEICPCSGRTHKLGSDGDRCGSLRTQSTGSLCDYKTGVHHD